MRCRWIPAGLADVLKGNGGRIKTVITDQKVIAGIGNAYSDEILHVARGCRRSRPRAN